jgi:ankyrin repeat protein
MSSNPLFDAIEAGDETGAIAIVRERPELARSHDEDGLSPLMQALYHGMEGVAAGLRDAAGDIDLFEAAAVGDVDRLEQLVRSGADPNAWSNDGFTALHLAAFFGQPEAARLLIERGANLEAVARNIRFAAGAHPLHSAVAAQDIEISRLLLEAGADPNSTQHGGFTPLLEAAQLADADMVDLLLGHGADPRARLEDGRSAVDLAEQAGREAVASRLREAAR